MHLGSGKMGSVYKITLNNGEILCVKILTRNHPSKLQDSRGWKLAYDYLDFDFKSCEDNQYFYFTIPYFEGELFYRAIQYCLRSRLQIIQNLIKAVDSLHRKGIIHRDLTWNNIIINNDEVYIIDFGRNVFISDPSTGKASADIEQLQLIEQGAFFSKIKKIFQLNTAPEFYEASYDENNCSSIGFRSDYYSIMPNFKFLISEHAHLADKILSTKGTDRNAALAEFSSQIDDLLMISKSSPKLNESGNAYSNAYISYKKITFFIRNILERLINLFRSPIPTSKNILRCNNDKNITIGFFKKEKQHPNTNLASFLPKKLTLCR